MGQFLTKGEAYGVKYAYFEPKDFVITSDKKIKLFRTRVHPDKQKNVISMYMCPNQFRGKAPTP